MESPRRKIELQAPHPESWLLDLVKKDLKARGWYFYRPVPVGYGGIPTLDLLACVNGFFVGIELKRTGKRPTPLQERTIGLIRESHGYAFWCDSFEMYEVEMEKVMSNLSPGGLP